MSSIPGRGTIVGRVFSPTRQLVRFSHLKMPSFQNSEFIWNVVLMGSSNYRPSAPFRHVKTVISAIIIIIIIMVSCH